MNKQKGSSADESARREAGTMLSNLFAAVTPLVEGNTDYCPSETALRPPVSHGNAPKGRSPFLISKLSSRSGESYNIKTSGIQAWKMFGIIDEVSALIGQEPRIIALTEQDVAIDAADPNQRKNIAKMRIEYPNNMSMYWTSVSGLNIHCPTRAVFNTLAQGFRPPERSLVD